MRKNIKENRKNNGRKEKQKEKRKATYLYFGIEGATVKTVIMHDECLYPSVMSLHAENTRHLRKIPHLQKQKRKKNISTRREGERKGAYPNGSIVGPGYQNSSSDKKTFHTFTVAFQ